MRVLHRLHYITEKAANQHAENVTFGQFAADWLFRLTGGFYMYIYLYLFI